MDSSSVLTDSCPGNVEGLSGYLFLTLINTLLNSKCKLGSKESYNEDYAHNLRNEDEFDFIVIGSGSAGSVVANRLSKIPHWKVLVLEAGGYPSATSDIPLLFFNLQGTEEDWQYKTEPSKNACLGFRNGQCRWPRGKVLGGSSTLNGMLFIEGHKRDYDHWAKLGNTGWDWKNVKKQFKEMENIHKFSYKYDSGEPIKYALQKSYELKGYQNIQGSSPENPTGSIEGNMCTQNGIRYNVGKAFLGKFKERPNLLVSLNSMVQKIVVDPKTKRATSVVVQIEGKTLTLRANKEIVLSAGSINSPHLLMLSGIGPKRNLEEVGIDLIKELPVGENLQDHIMHLGLDVALGADAVLPENKPEQMLNTLYQYFMHQKGSMESVGTLNYWGFINTKNDSIYPNIQYHHFLSSQNDRYFLPEVAKATGLADEVFSSKMDILKEHNLLTVATTLLNPKSIGKIILKSANPEDYPLIYSGYFSDENDEDIELMLEGIRFIEDLIKMSPIEKFHPEIKKLNLPPCDKYEFRSDEYWKCSLRHLTSTVYHPTSTCTMGPNDDGTAVVDPKLRVHGIKNLRVADASIMPKIVSANTHAPAMMIGHKAGSMIIEEWLKRRDEF